MEIWIIAGLALFISEAFIPLDFFLLFIGLACCITGVAQALGLDSAALQWLLAALLSLLFVFGIRPRVRGHFLKNQPAVPGGIEQDEVIPFEDIAPGAEGRGEARGTSWTVRNNTANVLSASSRCKVARRDGLTLIVE